MTLFQFKLLDKDKRYIMWLAKSVGIASYEKEGSMYYINWMIYQTFFHGKEKVISVSSVSENPNLLKTG